MTPHEKYKEIIPLRSVTGVLYRTIKEGFLMGHVSLRGRSTILRGTGMAGGGSYPYGYLDMIDEVFGAEQNTIEVCSGWVTEREAKTRVDIVPNRGNSNCAIDGQTLEGITDESFDRWRCDPPYNSWTAQMMYKTQMPNIGKLLKAGARVLKPGGLMFLLISSNRQHHPAGTKRIGFVTISVVPNNEFRVLNIYQKTKQQTLLTES